MKKLDDIPKNNPFKAPDGYFESLPGRIQSRISAGATDRERKFVMSFRMQYVLPILVVVILLGVYLFSGTGKTEDSEYLLSSVSTYDLVAYLDESELTTEDVLDNVEFTDADLMEIESEVYNQNLDGLEDSDIIDVDLENM